MATCTAGSSSKSPEVLRRRCSDILHEFLEMVNTRHLNPDHKFWRKNISPAYTYSGMHGDFAEYEPMNLESHLHALRTLALTTSPNFTLKVVDLLTETDEPGDGVKTYMRCDLLNSPDGVIRQSEAEVKWSYVGDNLVVLEVKAMLGVAPG